jgi:unsaturated rhamnogalacturonyl hydrolase
MIHRIVATRCLRLSFVITLLAGSLALAQATSAPSATLSPTNGAADVPLNVALSWIPVPNASAYEVYFGQGDSPAFQCRVTKPTFILETLTAGNTYRWRVDPVIDNKAKPGEVRSFTTTARADRDAVYAWSIRIANSVRAQYPQPTNLRDWNYTQGMICDALYQIAIRTGRDADIEYVKGWIDRYVNAEGVIDPTAYDFKLYSLDRVRPGPALLWMYQHTKDERYLKAAKLLIKQMDEQPRTSDGGFWHRSTYPNQMWLDGIYMADVYLAQYGAAMKEPKYLDEAVKQVLLIHKHTHDPKAGLYYHGWEETKTRPWANKETGTSPEFWGRAIGWYAMAMVDIMEQLPADHPGRKEILPIYQNLCASLVKVQDHDTAMWWQIMDKPAGPKNYVETSCSIMFAEAMAHGVQRGWLGPEYLEHARRATRGILNREVDLLEGDRMNIRGTVSVGSLGGDGGFYDYYVSVGLTTNDQKAVGAFMFLSMALSETANPMK